MPGYALTGTACVYAGEGVALTLTPSGVIASDTVTPSDGAGGGTFSPASVAITASAAPVVVAYSNPTPGTYSLAFASGAGHGIPASPFTLVVEAVPTPDGSARRFKKWFPGLRGNA